MPELDGRKNGSAGRRRTGGTVLIVDDDRGAGEVLVEALHHRKFVPRRASSAAEAMEVLASGAACDVVLTDLRMPGASGLELTAAIAREHTTIPVVVITAFGSIRAAIDAIRHGAYDFLTKPYDLELLALVLARAVEHHRTQLELEHLRAERGQNDDDASGLVPLEEIERRYILHAMRSLDGNEGAAARLLGLDRSVLHRKLELYGGLARRSEETK